MKTCRRVLSGFLCLLMVLMSTASATTTSARRDAALTIYYNGDAIPCEDGTKVTSGSNADGSDATYINRVLPIVYDESVYLPLYTCSRILGSELRYDDSTGTLRKTSRAVDTFIATDVQRPESTLVRRPLFSDTQKSQDIKITTTASVEYISSSTPSEDPTTVDLVFYEDMPYVDIKQLCDCVGLYCAENTMLNGIDIMSSTFKAALDNYLNTDSTRIECVYSEARGLRNWIYTNVLQESPSINYKFTVSKTGDGKCYCVVDRERFEELRGRVPDNTAKLQEIVDSLGLEGKTDREKVQYILTWIWDNYVYDIEASGKTKGRTAYSLLNDDKHVVCEGFARMFYLLCRQCGVQCQYLLGYTNMDGDSFILHAWNRVFIDDTWLYVDGTIGATVPSLRTKMTLVSEAKITEFHNEGTFKIGF